MTLALVDATTLIGGVDYTSQSNKVMLAAKAESLDVTTFRSGRYRSRIGGLRDVEATVDGFWAPDVDADAMGTLGTGNRPVTIAPTGAAGDVAYLFRAAVFEYELGDAVGAAFPFNIDLQATDSVGLVRGVFAAAPGPATAAGPVGSPVTLPAAAADQFVYATFHVTAGVSITVDLESDVDTDFADPDTVATLGPIAAPGGVWMTRVPGPKTDTVYRFNITAITGACTVAGAIAVQ